MSRIAKKPIKKTEGLSLSQEEKLVLVKGPKGEIKIPVSHGFSITKDEKNEIYFQIEGAEKRSQRAFLGLYASLIKSAAQGVLQGFSVGLELVGIGYKAQVQDKKLTLNVGYSNPVVLEIPDNLEVICSSTTNLLVKGIEKPLVTAFAAKIKKVRPPDPYKGKGIRYSGEIPRKKAGKTGNK